MVPDGDAVVPNSLPPKQIKCLSLGETIIEFTVVGVELVAPETNVALVGLVDASVPKR